MLPCRREIPGNSPDIHIGEGLEERKILNKQEKSTYRALF